MTDIYKKVDNKLEITQDVQTTQTISFPIEEIITNKQGCYDSFKYWEGLEDEFKKL